MILCLALTTLAGGVIAQVTPEHKSKLKGEARRWFQARYKVFIRCKSCNGSGTRERPVLTSGGLRNQLVPCKTCRKYGRILSESNLKGAYRPYLADAEIRPGIYGKPLKFRAAKQLFRTRRVEELKQRTGWIKDYPRVTKVEVVEHPTGLILGTVFSTQGGAVTRWVLVEKRWYVVAPDDERRLVAQAGLRARIIRAKTIHPRKDGRWLRAAKKIAKLVPAMEGEFAGRRLHVDKPAGAKAEVTLALEFDHGKGRPNPPDHEARRDRLLKSLVAAMQGKDWPRVAETIELRFALTAVAPDGKSHLRPVESFELTRTAAKALYLPLLDPAAVRKKFKSKSLLAKGWKVRGRGGKR